MLQSVNNAVQDSSAVDSAVVALREASADTTVGVLAQPANTVGEFLADLFGLPGYASLIFIKGLTIFTVFLLAWIVVKIVDRTIRTWLKHYESAPVMDPSRQRAATLGDLFRSAIRYVAWPMAFIMAVSELGFDVAALIATAGVAGLAIGFGAQTMVKDVISGIFLLFDDSIHVGDLIRMGDETGTVEFIGVRLIKVRKFNGELLMVPAGELRTFANASIGFARSIVSIGLAYEQSIEEALPAVKEIADAWHSENRENMLEDEPTVQAVTELGASQVTIRVVCQVVPGTQFELERKLRRMIKNQFDERGIEIPFPRQTLYLRREDNDK